MTHPATHDNRDMTVKPQILRITGPAAADITRRVAAYIRPRRSWTEVQVMSECAHGCKLYARKNGCVTQFRLFHSATYGCRLGRDKSTREVPVSVALKGQPSAPTTLGAIVRSCGGEASFLIDARVDLVAVGFDLDVVTAMSVSDVVRFSVVA